MLTPERHVSAPLLAPIGRFLSWWGRELAGLVPGAAQGRVRNTDRRFLVSIEAEGACLIDLRGGPSLETAARRLAATSHDKVLLQLADLGRSNAATAVGLRLPVSACFARRVELPAAASGDFGRLLALDFERATPFKAKDVYLAHYVEKTPAAPGKVWVRHLVLKRTAVDGWAADIKALGLDVGCVDCWDEGSANALPVNFLDYSTADAPPPRSRRSNLWLLGGVMVALAASGVFLVIDRFEAALQDLQMQTERQKAKAKAAREALALSQTAFSEIGNLYRLRNEAVTKLSVIEELTRLLPDTAWVTDLKIDGATIDISGFAKSAATLVPLLERSALFADATPTAPLTFDQREDKDRFAIRVHVRKVVAAIAPASTAPVPTAPVPTVPVPTVSIPTLSVPTELVR